MMTLEELREEGFTLAQTVDGLMKLPQHLCKQRGLCCKVAVFKGLSSHEDLLKQASIAGEEGEMARDFASIFVPYEQIEPVKQLAPDFVETVQQIAEKRGDNPENITFSPLRRRHIQIPEVEHRGIEK